jgi:hypothetical protein
VTYDMCMINELEESINFGEIRDLLNRGTSWVLSYVMWLLQLLCIHIFIYFVLQCY